MSETDLLVATQGKETQQHHTATSFSTRKMMPECGQPGIKKKTNFAFRSRRSVKSRIDYFHGNYASIPYKEKNETNMSCTSISNNPKKKKVYTFSSRVNKM
jgi:hypothetical protein